MYIKQVALVFLGCCLAINLASAARPQQRQNVPPRPPADIVKDNLDRVAGTPEQILEALNKDSGLMVEFKQLLAREAGTVGQIVEESDLSDAAIADRLRQDLRTRVLATRLLRRYGYLLPKLNPDSDLAAEHNLVLRERAKEIERASERRDPAADQPRIEQTDACDSPRSAQCSPSQRIPEGAPLETLPRDEILTPPERSTDQGRSASPPVRTAEESAPEGSPRDLLVASSGLDADTIQPRTPDRMSQASPASGRQEDAGSENSGRRASPAAAGGFFMPPLSFPELPPESREDATSAMNMNRSETGNPASRRRYERRTTDSERRESAVAEFEPVRMERRPNPYADVPSLYDLYVQATTPNRKMERFGLEVFRRGAADPGLLPMDLPAGPDYVVGPGDNLSVNLWGGVSQRLFRTVDREGRVALPEVGPVLVSGLTLGNAQEEVQRVLRTQFRNVSADVSLLRLRTVRIYVVGEVASPGGYDISSLSTPINALFAAGGVTPLGSLRKLEHYRGKQLIEVVDGYDLLLHGVRGALQHLENGDSLRVPPLAASVVVDGMVRRPGCYELDKEKNLSEVLQLAGGILPAAALRHIEVQRLAAHDKRTMLSLDVGEMSDPETLRAALEQFAIQDGDEVHIFPIAPYNSDAVYLDGHALRPGQYAYRDGMRFTDLVTSYKDLLPEPAGRYAEIIHIRAPDYRPVVESFDLAAAFEHPEGAPKLEPLDTVRIFGRYDFEPAPEILITGEVRTPGRYRTPGQQRLRDALYQAGGVTPDAWLDAAQLFRQQPGGTMQVFSVNLRGALDGSPLDNIFVEPRDRILIHRQPEKVAPASVSIRGDVARPGRYPLAANMRLSDLIGSAGGLLRSANPDSGDLTHYAPGGGTSGSPQVTGDQRVDLGATLRHEAADDVPLRDGDVLTVPQQKGWKDIGATVTLGGEVAKPGVYGIQPGERLSSLLRRAGGLSPGAFPPAAVFERVSVREMQQQSRQDLIQRLEQESITVKTSLTSTGTDESALQQAATQQRQRVLDALRRAPVSGRLVVHVREREKNFENSPDDIELRAGDTLQIPKQPGFVLIVGQVYNSNAITYTPKKNARWYLSRAGGATPLANRKTIFIVRADGAVTSGQGEIWSGGALAALVGPGDTIVVPEKTVLGGSGWKNLVAVAQIAQAAALAAAVAIP
jgi:polysaccharide biosynthesis/export protein